MRVHATRFNAPDGKKDKNGRTFAEDWEKKGHGEWCHGRVTFVYKKKSRQPQKYRILYDEGTVMESLEEHMEATAEGDSDDEEDTTEDLEYTQAEVEDQEDGPPGNEEEGEDHKYELWMIDATLAIVLGGAQFKEGTDLWATKTMGLMPPPDFGKHLSRDKFKRIIRYWSRGLKAERDRLRLNPWAQVDSWVKGYNEARLREIRPGTCLTPDEMMLEWKGKAGFGGLPHLSFIKRKPQPLGTELKSLCRL